MYLPIAIFFLVGTLALLAVTVTSDRPRSAMYRALSWSAVASLASTFAWTAVGGFQPVPSAIFTVQTFLYGISTLPLRNWAADYARRLEQEQSKRRARELMVEFDEQLEQMDESTRQRVMDACSRQLEDEYREQKWREEVEAEQEWQRERRSILDGHDGMEQCLARREAAYKKWQEREREREREWEAAYEKWRLSRQSEWHQQFEIDLRRARSNAEWERHRRPALADYSEALQHSQGEEVSLPSDTALREWVSTCRRVATLAGDYGIDPADFSYRRDGDRLVVDGDDLPAEFQERANRQLDSDGVREAMQGVSDYRATMERLRREIGQTLETANHLLRIN